MISAVIDIGTNSTRLFVADEKLNPIKKMLLEKKRREAEISQNNTTQSISNTEVKQSFCSDFSQGDRVFHSKFGVGKIIEVKEVGNEPMIIVDFGVQGQKAMDLETANLKKF